MPLASAILSRVLPSGAANVSIPSGTLGVSGSVLAGEDVSAQEDATIGGDLAVTGNVSAATFNGSPLPSGGITQLTGPVTAGPGTGSQATALTNNGVTDAALRQSVALSLVGRSANSTGNVADISATPASGAAMRESGSAIGFGTLQTAAYADASVTLAKQANLAADTIQGRANGAGTGVPTALTAVQVCAILSAANDTITTAGSNLTDLTTSGLDGDADGDYRGQVTLTANGGSADFTYQPNSVGTNQKCAGIYNGTGGDPAAVAGEDRADLLLGAADAAASVVQSWYQFMSKSGRTRFFECTTYQDSGGTGDYHETMGGRWTGSGNQTAAGVHASAASRIATGSFHRITRLRNGT